MKAIILFIQLICIGAVFGYKETSKKVKDAYCNDTLAPADAVAIEHAAYLKYNEKKKLTNYGLYEQHSAIIGTFVPEIVALLTPAKDLLIKKQTDLNTQLEPYLEDPLVSYATPLKDAVAVYVTNMTGMIDNLITTLPIPINEFTGAYNTLMVYVYEGILGDLAIVVGAIEQAILGETPNAATCACKTLRKFTRFALEQINFQSDCSRTATDRLKSLHEILVKMIKNLNKKIVAPITAISHCFAHIEAEVTDETKTILNFCIQAHFDRLSVYQEDLNNIATSIIDYWTFNVKFISESFVTCSNEVVNEYIITRGYLDFTYGQCLGMTAPGDQSISSVSTIASNPISIKDFQTILNNLPPFTATTKTKRN